MGFFVIADSAFFASFASFADKAIALSTLA